VRAIEYPDAGMTGCLDARVRTGPSDCVIVRSGVGAGLLALARSVLARTYWGSALVCSRSMFELTCGGDRVLRHSYAGGSSSGGRQRASGGLGFEMWYFRGGTIVGRILTYLKTR
jgi:hypothetical protein